MELLMIWITCPNTPSGESVDAQGCSNSQLNSDGDGISDDVDQCPDTEIGVTINASGCQITYVPDDTFEQYLIDLDNDDVLDDYVLTDNIRNIEDFIIYLRTPPIPVCILISQELKILKT